jgi:uncharacterized protein (UPF0332 family)
MDWEECFKKRIVKEIKRDTDLIKSLIENSRNKLESSNELKMNEITAISKFSLAYDSLREILEALSIEKGYKIYNYECFTAFLKEILNEKEKGNNFDEIRKIRNDVNYYGKQITIEEAEEIIDKIKNLRQEIFNILKSN